MNHYNNTPQNYLIWMKSKIPSSPWDEEHLGGLVWPPRFYSCSFCRREFRSAQALGGHMNVHRRDRAKLKQSCISDQEILSFSDSKTTTEENTRKLSDHDGDVAVCKRLKKSGVSPLVPFLYCSSSSSREEIDLELRLGDPPAVK